MNAEEKAASANGENPAGKAGNPGVVRCDLGPAEWALLTVTGRRPQPEDLKGALAELAARTWPPLLLPESFRRVPLPPDLGLAVAHHRGGRTVAYCSEDHMTGLAADALTGMAARAGALSRVAADPGRPLEVRVTVAQHQEFGAAHPVAAFSEGRILVAVVCSDLITRRLAGTLTVLGSAHMRILAASPDALDALQLS